MTTAAYRPYPVRVEAALDRPSRWLWLVKWLLVIPHYVVLAFLWLAFVLLSIGAFFAILFTGRYPRGIFEFNLGVLRWSWRVSYYAYNALGTDRYPPFTLKDVPDYPARLDIAYPEHLSRGLVLVKWWLLAIPHYLIVGLFLGGGAWAAGRADEWRWGWGSGGLVGILVLVSAVILAFTGRYPGTLFDFILGMNRWALRVAGYAGLMTDDYPPFRLDMGGHEPGSPMTITTAPPPTSPTSPTLQPTLQPTPQPSPPPPEPPARRGWTAARIVAVVAGSVLTLVSVGLLISGAAALWADQTQRTGDYLTSGKRTLVTSTYAVTTKRIDLRAEGPDWAYPASILDRVRIRVTAVDPSRPIFVGIAPQDRLESFLAGTRHATVQDLADGEVRYQVSGSGKPPDPATSDIWVARASGTGTQTLTWDVQSGQWGVLVMNADASPGIFVRADVGATVPALTGVAVGLLVAGAVLLAAGVLLIVLPVRRAGAG